MAANDAEVQQQSGTAEQLPKGAASDLNAVNPYAGSVGAPDAAMAPEPEAVIGDEDPALLDPNFAPGDSVEEQMLFLDAPNERSTSGSAPIMTPQMPLAVYRQLGALREAASRPGAPRSLVLMYRAAVNAMERDLRR